MNDALHRRQKPPAPKSVDASQRTSTSHVVEEEKPMNQLHVRFHVVKKTLSEMVAARLRASSLPPDAPWCLSRCFSACNAVTERIIAVHAVEIH